MKNFIAFLLLIILSFLPINANEIDSFFEQSNSSPNRICSDQTFVRRTFLTMTGRIPSSQKVTSFLNDKSDNKRSKLIDEILSSDEYVRYTLMKWGDILRIKSEFPSNLWPNGVQAYNRWVYHNLSVNTPYNIMIHDLLLSNGSDFKDPAVNFYRAFLKRSPEAIYNNINLLFLGMRSNKDDGYHCFDQISYKSTKEWKEEIVYIDIHKALQKNDISLYDGTNLLIKANTDWRVPYINWLTSKDNRQFAAVMANRVWYWIMGEGIVNQPDDWREDNLPSNKELLDFITDYFIKSNFDVRALSALILNSNYYQNKALPEGSYKPQRLPAEVIVDALSDLTGIWDTYSSRVPEPFTFYPPKTRAVNLGDATVSSSILELFGKVSRDVSLESQRNNNVTARQLLYLMNSTELEDRLHKSQVLNALSKGAKGYAAICKGVTLMTLSRMPTDDEIKLFTQYAKKNKVSLRNLATDIMWTEINSNEFLFNH